MKALADAQAAALAAKDKEYQEALADLQAAHAAVIAELRAQIAALGGTELGQKMARDVERQALLDAKATAEAKLAELDTADQRE